MPPNAWYTSEHLARLEAMTTFCRNWIAVARADELSQVGAFVTGTVVGEPFVIVRQANGELTAFNNVCSHRAAKVVRERWVGTD